MAGDISEVVNKLSLSINAQLNPLSSHETRHEAYQFLEDFKKNCETSLCIKAALQLASPYMSDMIRHCGLQLVENCVVDKWNTLNSEEKIFIKNSTMQLLEKGTKNILIEEFHVKDALSRITVEMIKREWPQQWPALLTELNELHKLGPTQCELVLLVFLRLAEDVVHFMNVPNQRRKDIFSTLTSNMDTIFSFFLDVLKTNVRLYQENLDNETGKVHCRVAETSLLVLQGYVDWVVISHITAYQNLLFQMLCLLLSDAKLRIPAAECLLEIVERKGKPEDRKPLLILFSEDAMGTILDAARCAAAAGVDEENYRFLKKLCQVLTGIGAQLAYLWGMENMDVGQPSNFETYLKALMAFTQHPSQMLGMMAYSQWAVFLRHKNICNDELLLKMIHPLSKQATKSLLKYGFPSLYNSTNCEYSRLDFDSDDEFNTFFARFRTDVTAVIRLATDLAPSMIFQMATEWLDRQLLKPVELGPATGYCNLNSPGHIEWDALSVYLDSILSRHILVESSNLSDQQKGLRLLRAVLTYETQDPLILSSVVSCMSALFVYVRYAPDVLPLVLDKLFACVVFSVEGQTMGRRVRAVRNVRRHACFILPGFDQLFSHIKMICNDPEQLSQMERCTLWEALLLISNEFCNFQKQSEFIKVIIEPVKIVWNCDEIKLALTNTDAFLTYIGLNQAAVDCNNQNLCGIRRSQMLYGINLVLAVMKRSKWPVDIEVAKKGGFVKSVNGREILCNPATKQISQLLGNLFPLMRILNELWLPENISKVHPDFSQSMFLSENEKLQVLGIQPSCIDTTNTIVIKNPCELMRKFLHDLHDNSYHILGNSAACLGEEFLMEPCLSSMIIESVFTNILVIPDFRLKPIIRAFLKPFVQHCHKENYTSLVIPILMKLCPFMFQRLNEKWALIHQHYNEGLLTDDEQNPECKEVLDDQLCRIITREYLEFIGVVCRESKHVSEEETTMESTVDNKTQKEEVALSELAKLAIANEQICQSMVLTIFTGLTWDDTNTYSKCSQLTMPILRQILADGYLTEEAASHLLAFVINSLQIHGQHESLQSILVSLAVQVYSLLRPVYGLMSSVLEVNTSAKEAAVQEFDERYLLHAKKNGKSQAEISERKKREDFKKIIVNIIGKNVGQMFKRNITIKNLPTLFKRKKPKQDPVEDASGGLYSLFS